MRGPRAPSPCACIPMRTACQSAAHTACQSAAPLPCVSTPVCPLLPRALRAPWPCTQPSPCQRGNAACRPRAPSRRPCVCVCLCARRASRRVLARVCPRLCVCLSAPPTTSSFDRARADYMDDPRRDAVHVLYPPHIVAVFEIPCGDADTTPSRRVTRTGDPGQRRRGGPVLTSSLPLSAQASLGGEGHSNNNNNSE